MRNILTLLALTFLACNLQKTPSLPVSQPSAFAKLSVQDSIPFPVYLSFDQFEPLLRLDNDTTYVFNFWATWCKPCIAEMPFFQKLIEDSAGKPVRIILTSMDFPKDIPKKLVPWVLERNLAGYTVALADMDYNSWIDKVSTHWDGAIPFTLVRRRKRVVTHSGELSGYEDLQKMLTAVAGQ